MSRGWIEDTWRNASGEPTAASGRGYRWRAYWYEVSHAEGGTRRHRRARRFRTKGEAERHLDGVLRAQQGGSYSTPAQRDLTLREAAGEWLSTRHSIKDSTHRRYQRDLDNYVLPRWGERTLVSITRREAAAWVTALRDGSAPAAYRARGAGASQLITAPMNGPLSPRGIKHVVQVAGSVLAWAIDTEVARSNPFARLSMPRLMKDEHLYLNHTQVAHLAQSVYDTTGNPTDRALVEFLAYTGLRINEALALRIESVDLGARRATIRESWTADRTGTLVLGAPKSGRSRRVSIPPFMIDSLRQLCAGRDRDDFVFTAARGGPISDHNWRSRVFNPARKAAGLPDGLTPHKLRHTAASMAIAAGADVKLVQQMLGHADAAETLNTYAHLWPDHLDTVADALDAARSAALAREDHAHVPKMSPQGESAA